MTSRPQDADDAIWWPGADTLNGIVRAIERQRALELPARLLDPLADWLVATPMRRELLTGRWIGHAAHPFMTDIPIGSWTSASILDLLGGRDARPGAELLTAIGTISAAPTIATGLAEWSTTEGAARRVGVVHAAIERGGCRALRRLVVGPPAWPPSARRAPRSGRDDRRNGRRIPRRAHDQRSEGVDDREQQGRQAPGSPECEPSGGLRSTGEDFRYLHRSRSTT